MNRKSSINFAEYMLGAQKNNEVALRCEKRIRTCILEAGLDSSLLLRSVAHQLMIYISSIILRNETQDYRISCESFPYLPGQYWQNPTNIKFRKHTHTPIYSYSFNRKIFVEITTTYKARLRLRVINRFWTLLYKGLVALGMTSQVPCKLKEKYEAGQIVLRKCIKSLAKEVGLDQNYHEVFENNFVNFVESYASFFYGPSANALISGTSCKMQASARMFTYRCHELPVTVEDHGSFSIILHDEPLAIIGELGLCTHFRTYGDIPWLNAMIAGSETKIAHPKITNLPAYTKQKKKHETVSKNKRLTKTGKLLYVPTSFSSFKRYLPFRDYSDEVYLSWQHILLSELSSLGFSIDYKAHPKNKIDLFDNRHTVIKKTLEEVDLEVYDAVILDYVSTGFKHVQSASTPLWFFDIGLRRMQPYFYEHFETMGVKRIDFTRDLPQQIKSICYAYQSENYIKRVRLY